MNTYASLEPEKFNLPGSQIVNQETQKKTVNLFIDPVPLREIHP